LFFFINKNKLLYDFYKEAAGFKSINLYLNVQNLFPFCIFFYCYPVQYSYCSESLRIICTSSSSKTAVTLGHPYIPIAEIICHVCTFQPTTITNNKTRIAELLLPLCCSTFIYVYFFHYFAAPQSFGLKLALKIFGLCLLWGICFKFMSERNEGAARRAC